MDVHEAAAALKRHNVEYLFAQCVDLYGVPRAKLVPVDHILDLIPPDGGAFFAGGVCALAATAAAITTARAITIFFTVPPGEQKRVRNPLVQWDCRACHTLATIYN